MAHIIDFENKYTYPEWIWTLFSEYPAFQIVYEHAQGDRGDFSYWLEKYIDDADGLINAIKQNLKNWGFVAYHITRVVDVESVKQKGLQVMESHDYMNRMEYIFIHVLKYTCDEVTRCKNVLGKKLTREQACRIGQLSFFAPPSKYNLEKRDNGYLSLYGSIVGGEVANQAFQGNEKVLSDLHKSGKTLLIKAKFHIATLLENCENDAYGFMCSLLYFAAQYFYSKHLNNDAIILGQVSQPVQPKNICEVITIDNIG